MDGVVKAFDSTESQDMAVFGLQDKKNTVGNRCKNGILKKSCVGSNYWEIVYKDLPSELAKLAKVFTTRVEWKGPLLQVCTPSSTGMESHRFSSTATYV